MTKEELIEQGYVDIGGGQWVKATSKQAKQLSTGIGGPEDFSPASESKPTFKTIAGELTGMRKVTLVLRGEPMPKQSARFYCTGKVRPGSKSHIIVSYQPKEMEERKKDYQAQLRDQMPPGWEPFERRVHVRKLHYVYSPLKSFSKSTMEAIKAGYTVYKETQPDLVDNLKKLVFDSMAGIVFRNDGGIVSEDNVKKYYGLGGCIIIELEGI